MKRSTVPNVRTRKLNESTVRADGQYVLYWMTAFRRTQYNFALQRARDWATELAKPLLILEGLRCDYPWACDRFHRFIIEGMVDNRDSLCAGPVLYYPYVEPQLHAGRGLVVQLARKACIVISDDFPCFFHPGMYHSLAKRLDCQFEIVDSNGLMPLAVADRTFTVAHSYRRWMQKELPSHLEHGPEPDPLATSAAKRLPRFDELPHGVANQWPAADLDSLLGSNGLNELPIDHSVGSVTTPGGSHAAERQLNTFVKHRLNNYDHDRNEPDVKGSSELSAYLHFGHMSAQQFFWAIMHAQDWHPQKLRKPNGKTNGFWGVDENAEAVLDQLCTWREIGFNMCFREPNYDRFDSLPNWAIQTLAEHSIDKRPYVYSLEQLEAAQTHDPIWNAAQRQLVVEGKVHNYMRMLWGKKILHWTRTPEQSLDWMIHLNNKYALDGRDPNSYSGIFWVLGRYDRAWGPEREVFGKIRYMTSENTARKHQLSQYLVRYAEQKRHKNTQ